MIMVLAIECDAEIGNFGCINHHVLCVKPSDIGEEIIRLKFLILDFFANHNLGLGTGQVLLLNRLDSELARYK
jgi:hypothetical protein